MSLLAPRGLRGAGSAVAAAVLVVMASCQDASAPGDQPGTPPQDPSAANPDWTQATHGKADPRYDIVFPQDSVGRLDITMTAGQWNAIRANMRSLWGLDFGAGAAGIGLSEVEPDYVDVTVGFAGRRWLHVGLRLKGHQSLLYSWRNGIHKLPFRLDFERFEDSIPAVRDQRFHGFKELSMAPGFSDPSLMRDRLAAEVFRMAGIPTAETAFYRVYIDFGEGPRYCGVYTVVEVIDDTMVKRWFGEDDGNIYKPESRLESFAPSDFEKKNNQGEPDWSDARAAIDALNSPLRVTDPARWRAGLEASFDVDHFLRWLAASNVLVNKDSYGGQAHNYYLYRHSRRGLIWIPWDHNLALRGSPGVASEGRRSSDGLSLRMDEVDDGWPLIRHLMDDPVYWDRYSAHARAFAEVCTAERTDALVERYAPLISPWVVGPGGEQPGYSHLSTQGAFPIGVGELRQHLRDRRALLDRFLAGGR